MQRAFGGMERFAVGFGAMSFGLFYGPTDEESSMRTLARALELGRFMGPRRCLRRRTLRAGDRKVPGRRPGRPAGWTLTTKFAIRRRTTARASSTIAPLTSAEPGSVDEAAGVDHIDLYYVHRVDEAIPIEDTVDELGRRLKRA